MLRRTSPRSYYAAVYDTGRGALRLLRRSGVELVELASTPVPAAEPPLRLVLSATGAHPTELRCELTDSRGVAVSATARDEARGLQRKGDPGVLATAETLFPSDANPVLPALGNLHLLPWAVQEGQAFMATQLGQAVVDEIRRRSTVAFSEITVRSAGRTAAASERGRRAGGHHGPRRSPAAPSCTSPPTSRRARRSRSRTRRGSGTRAAIDVGRTDRFQAVDQAGARARARAAGVLARAPARGAAGARSGPARSFRVPPERGGAARVAVAACGAQFGPIFEHLAERKPDVFVWQGDLNYPDTHGPLAQTTSAYAGIWRDFLANPLLEPILARRRSRRSATTTTTASRTRTPRRPATSRGDSRRGTR